jgi:cyclopropane-fatty-acyl-phospholipid synthase
MEMYKNICHNFFKGLEDADFEISYWDGDTVAYGRGSPKVKLFFKKPLPVNLDPGSMVLTMGEAYMDGLVDFEGDMAEILRIVQRNGVIAGSRGLTGRISSALGSLGNSRSRQKKNIQHHYDLGNDFFALWLDETMSYSCAYFKTPGDTLYQAQINKIDHILKKLQLRPGERLLDIGCGWGWLAVKAAREHGAEVLGITLSREQHRSALDRVEKEGLSGKVDIQLVNYLDLAGGGQHFDKIVSVGMFEHVGRENLSRYMEAVHRLLRPGGLSLLHSIMGTDENPVNPWIEKYIFPGGYIPSLRETLWLLPEYNFHLLHAESLRLHYAQTLDRWYGNFQKNIPAVRKKFGDRFVRMWSLYLIGCAASFRSTGLNVYQLVFSKGLNNDLPITLDHLY